MTDELRGENMKEFVVCRPKMYSYIIDGRDDGKKQQVQKSE